MPTVSVLMPSYNHGRFLPETLKAMQGQTFEDWELIAVDDGSQDDSVSILEDWSSGDSRIKVQTNERNLGTYGTLARALALSSGPYVAVLDSDDLWDLDKLGLQMAMLEDHPELSACYTAGRAFGDSAPGEEVHGDWPTDPVQELLPRLLEENRVLASSVMFRRADAAFNPSLRYSGDWEALLRACLRSPIGYLPKPLTGWRLHGANSFVRSPGQVAEEIRLRSSILAKPEVWSVRSIPIEQTRTGLSRCALHLSALFVLRGQMPEARKVARAAVRTDRSPATLKRLAVVSLPAATALKKLWPTSPPLTPTPPDPLLTFSQPE